MALYRAAHWLLLCLKLACRSYLSIHSLWRICQYRIRLLRLAELHAL